MIFRAVWIAALWLMTMGVPSHAQQSNENRGTVLLMDRVTRTAHVPVPRLGQGMKAVRASFGEPDRIVGAVGEPPITRWIYAEFTVYFEGERVIHAVVNRGSETETLG